MEKKREYSIYTWDGLPQKPTSAVQGLKAEHIRANCKDFTTTSPLIVVGQGEEGQKGLAFDPGIAIQMLSRKI